MVVLSGYVDGRMHALDPNTGTVDAAARDAPVDGFGQWRGLGLFGRGRRAFVAVFVRGDDFVLWIKGHEFRLLKPGISALLHDTTFFPTRRFRLSEDEATVFEANYWFFLRRAWPDDGDIFSLVCRIVGSSDKGRGFLQVWRARRAGRDVSSKKFLSELQSLVEADPPGGKDTG